MFYHLKIIVRNLQRDKFHSTINIGGLSIGMAAAIFFVLGFILFTGLLAVSYPAFYLSAFPPVSVFKGVVSVADPRVTLRKQLVVMQFSFAVLLIFGTLVMRMQIFHAQNRNSGYDRERLIHTPLPESIKNHYQAFRNDLTVSGAITDITDRF